MEVFLIGNYRSRYSELRGRELTDRLITGLLTKKSAYGAGLRAEDVSIHRDESGKPSVIWTRDEAAPFISVSHSEDVFACAFGETEIGIDIQHEREVDTAKIGGRFFSSEEISKVREDETSKTFFSIWTRKEAYAKYTGRGLAQVMSGEGVLRREDLIFDEFEMMDGLHVCICRSAGESNGGGYEIQFFDREQDGQSRNNG